MSEIKLLPCPFCNGEVYLSLDNIDASTQIPYCKCEDCGNTTYFDTLEKEVAIGIWNTRKPMERIIEKLEEKKRSDGTESDREWGKYIGYVDSIKIVKEEGGIE